MRSGAPCRIRTCDVLIRSQALYPAEVRARVAPKGLSILPPASASVNAGLEQVRCQLAESEGFEPSKGLYGPLLA